MIMLMFLYDGIPTDFSIAITITTMTKAMFFMKCISFYN